MRNSNPVKLGPLKPGQASAANLANLLPTGTVLAAQALIPSFTNNGECVLANEYLTLGIIVCCSLACFLSSFTDSFTGKDGTIYYGIATPTGFCVFNDVNNHDDAGGEEEDNKDRHITPKDFVHAFTSLTVFLVFALSDSNVQKCFFPKAGANEKTIIMNLPLGAGLLASLLFMLFPTTRRGIGYGDSTAPDVKLDKKGIGYGDTAPVKVDKKGEEHAPSNKESA